MYQLTHRMSVMYTNYTLKNDTVSEFDVFGFLFKKKTGPTVVKKSETFLFLITYGCQVFQNSSNFIQCN